MLSGMRLARLLLSTALALAPALAPAPAEACSPPLPPDQFYTFNDSLPGNGATGVPVDGAILLTPRSWRVQNASVEVDDRFSGALTVTVTDTQTGEAVPGLYGEWWGEPSGVLWKAERPLQPGRRYALVGILQQVHTRPAEAEGPTELRVSFTTGTEATPPMELLGALSVSLERFETDKLECGSGNCGCTVVGRELSTRARLQLPGVRGGASLGTYRYELWVSNGTPHRFDGTSPTVPHEVHWGVWGVNTPGTAVETLFEMPRNPYGKPYTPCFAWRAVDPSGQRREGAPVCLLEEVPVPGGEVPRPIDLEPGDDVIEDDNPLGCAASGPGGAAPLALLGLLATLWRSRARRG
jgi:uncharacterized protein (TIGR03382 family)